MSDDLSESIRSTASAPKRAKTEAGEMEQHGLPDQIAADRYLASKQAAGGKGLGVKMSRMVPPGAG